MYWRWTEYDRELALQALYVDKLVSNLCKTKQPQQQQQQQVFNSLFQNNRKSKGKSVSIITNKKLTGWKWHQRDLMQWMYNSLDSYKLFQHFIIHFYLQTGCSSCCTTNRVKQEGLAVASIPRDAVV